MASLADVIQGIHDIRKKMADENPANALGETFYKATLMLFESFKFDYFSMKHPDSKITIKDVEFDDGYYIFGFGSNSVVTFTVEECPEWRFGIWWCAPTTTYVKNSDGVVEEKVSPFISAQVFAQFERTIDKFKPSYSTFCKTIYIRPEGADTYDPDVSKNTEYFIEHGIDNEDVHRMINYIVEEPYLAFYRSWHGADYNEEYVTRGKAKAEYTRYITQDNNEKEFIANSDKDMYNYIKDNILPLFDGSEIIDMGPGWSPRYDIVAPFALNKVKYELPQPGCYGLYADEEKDEELVKAIKGYEKKYRDLDKQANRHHYWWGRSFDSNITINFYSEDSKEEVEDENGADPE